jgi:hypothetical protein
MIKNSSHGTALDSSDDRSSEEWVTPNRRRLNPLSLCFTTSDKLDMTNDCISTTSSLGENSAEAKDEKIENDGIFTLHPKSTQLSLSLRGALRLTMTTVKQVIKWGRYGNVGGREIQQARYSQLFHDTPVVNDIVC